MSARPAYLLPDSLVRVCAPKMKLERFRAILRNSLSSATPPAGAPASPVAPPAAAEAAEAAARDLARGDSAAKLSLLLGPPAPLVAAEAVGDFFGLAMRETVAPPGL